MNNAELWSHPDEESQYRTITCWLKDNNIKYNEDESLEDLIQLYRDIETGKYSV